MAMLSCVFHAYDKYLASILNEDHVDDDGFTIVPQQAKVCMLTKSFTLMCVVLVAHYGIGGGNPAWELFHFP